MTNFWQMAAYRIAKRIAETSHRDLTFDMVKEVEAELRTINDMYITKLYIGMIKPEHQKEVEEAMTELVKKRGCRFE